MKIDYKSKKWDKEIKEFKKLKEYLWSNQNEQLLIQRFLKDQDFQDFYASLALKYNCLADKKYLFDYIDDAIKYTYLSGYALLLAYCIYKKGPDSNYNRRIESLLAGIDYALYQLIATGEIENDYISKLDDHLIVLMYHKKYEQVKLKLEQLSETPKQSLYYVHPSYLKETYMAIIEHDEKKFNDELVKRIKTYRKNMVGYSVMIDAVSVALIKMAQREGINCTVDVIEIPKQFFDENYAINVEECKLPYYDEFLQQGLIE